MTRDDSVPRRVLLGAACARALAVSARAFPGSSFQRRLESRRRWDRAVALLRRAESALHAAEGDADETLFDRRLGAFYRALRRLLRTPAPDLRCLALKLDLAIDHEIAELTGGKACLIALKQDARRLAGWAGGGESATVPET